MDEIRGTAQGTAPLSVLDLVTVGVGHTATDALRRTGLPHFRLLSSGGPP